MRTCGSCASMDNIIGIIVSIVGYTIIFSFYSSSCSFLLAASCYLVVRGIYSMRFRGMMWIKSYRACVIYIYIYIYIRVRVGEGEYRVTLLFQFYLVVTF